MYSILFVITSIVFVWWTLREIKSYQEAKYQTKNRAHPFGDLSKDGEWDPKINAEFEKIMLINMNDENEVGEKSQDQDNHSDTAKKDDTGKESP